MFTKDYVHHAYILEGDRKSVLDDLYSKIKKEFKIERIGNPDFFSEEFDVLGIDDARRIKEIQSNASFDGGRKIFVISANSITREAQNALLKVFEEPTDKTHFFVVTPSLSGLLPTVISRAVVIKMKTPVSNVFDVKSFVSALPAERLLIIKDIVEEKDKSKASSFLKELAFCLQDERMNKLSKNRLRALEILSKNISYIGDRSSSVKLILESVALTL